MKTKHFLWGALAVLSLAACSEDKDVSPSEQAAQSAKITINLMSNNSLTRAEKPGDKDFDEGTTDEHEIKSAVLVFYDSQKNPLTRVNITSADLKDTDKAMPNVELLGTLEVNVALANGQYPSYLMVYANPIKTTDLEFPLTPASIATVTRSDIWGAGNTFPMNNSVYYDEKGVLQREVALSRNNFYQTDEEKSKASSVRVYIERVAGKVTLKPANGQSSLGTQSGEINNKKLEFTPISWGVNAVAKKFYLIKRFSYTSDATDLGWLNENFKTFVPNEADRHRSYWAVSPHYAYPSDEETFDVSKYPYVSSDIEDSNWLNYYSWNQFTKEADEETTSKRVEIGDPTYTMENTVNSLMYNTTDAFINKNAALVSALVLGQYTVDGKVEDFYIHGSNLYLKKDYIAAMANLALLEVSEDVTDLDDVFQIEHPESNLAGTNKEFVEENKVVITIKKEAVGKVKYKSGSETIEVTNDNLSETNKKIQEICGLASAYTKGMAYFNVPIRHLGNRANEKDAWPAGSFGVVRNHSYVITVDGFAPLTTATIGHGVLNPDHPIVPPSDPNDKFGIKAEIRVLSWRLVDQHVTLGKK